MSRLAAYFTSGGALRHSVLTLYRITDGRRLFIHEQTVAGRREARTVAKALGAEPWNF